MRAGEIFALEWRHVDLDRAEVHIVTSKVGTPRTVPLSARAVAILRAQTRHLKCPRVFWRGKGEPRLEVPRSYRKAVERAEINDFTFHDLRHHFASRQVQNGMDLYRLGRILGHSRPETTQRYAHLATEHLHEAMRDSAHSSAQ
jgi:integrase